MKKSLFLSALFIVPCFLVAQLKSPKEFLGYELGSKYTPHHRIVSYFAHVAENAGDRVKLEKYGETNEGRPLMVAFVSSAENISQLENIRQNNLSLARMTSRQASGPRAVITWLSYNVHGNETSSSEASMKTLYALVDPINRASKQWLQNSVIVIDPCLNPDGRERYINWYNTMLGKHWNPLPIAREHREPWPGGRSNHYNYDLNRDWVWQTQVESRARMALYNKWLPQIHVDFHEQNVNAPYFFAPAAEPYHESITTWQRDFQKTIGQNNARYFDENGWLYFTGQWFDLFYPSYGDTYPLFNGAIGMTYEQGGITAGLGIHTNNKDTLTLTDRVLHHYTSGMSTIEIASKHAQKLLDEYGRYFNDAVSGKVGDYKTYIIKNKPEEEQRINALMKLMDQNGIRYGTSSGSGKGFSYFSKKQESFSIGSNDLVISAVQPKSVLVKVLFEPQSNLVDSVTYDITAWALPYAYGLTAYASQQNFKVDEGGKIVDFKPNSPTGDAYGYIIKWQGLQSVKTVGSLLQKGLRLRFSEVPFKTGGEEFDRGSIIVAREGNNKFGNDLGRVLSEICNENEVALYRAASGMMEKGADFGSDLLHVLKPVKVAMLTGESVSQYSAGQIWDYFDNQISYPVTLVNAGDFERMPLSDFDVLILPAGRYNFLTNKGAATLEDWVRQGGKLIAFESAVEQLAKQDWSVMKLQADTADKKSNETVERYSSLRTFENRERDMISDYIPGAIYRADVDNTHPLMFGYPSYYYTLKLSPDLYEYIKEGGWNAGYLKKENYVSGHVGFQLIPKLKDGLLFGVQDLGRGSVVYFTDDVIFRNFWETGKLMLANAIFMVGQ